MTTSRRKSTSFAAHAVGTPTPTSGTRDSHGAASASTTESSQAGTHRWQGGRGSWCSCGQRLCVQVVGHSI